MKSWPLKFQQTKANVIKLPLLPKKEAKPKIIEANVH